LNDICDNQTKNIITISKYCGLRQTYKQNTNLSIQHYKIGVLPLLHN